MYKKCKKKVNWSVDDQRLKSKEDKDRDQLELCSCTVIKNSNKEHQTKMASMTICNLFLADGATLDGNMSKLILPRLNFSRVQIELTVSDTTIISRWENLIEASIEPTATTTKTPDFKLPMGDSLTRKSKLEFRNLFFMHFYLLVTHW